MAQLRAAPGQEGRKDRCQLRRVWKLLRCGFGLPDLPELLQEGKPVWLCLRQHPLLQLRWGLGQEPKQVLLGEAVHRQPLDEALRATEGKLLLLALQACAGGAQWLLLIVLDRKSV